MEKIWHTGAARALAPALLALASAAAATGAIHTEWLRDGLLLAALLLAAAVVARAQYRRALSLRPECEPALNRPAIDWLDAPGGFERVRLDTELPRESVYLPGRRPRWLLVTNRRILLFAASARERRLQSEWPRRAIVFAGAPEQLPGHRSALQRLLKPANLVLSFTTGTTLYLDCASRATADRVAQLLMSSPALPEESGGNSVLIPRGPRRRWHEVIASLLVPGAGQCLQGRLAAGAALFMAALLLGLYGGMSLARSLHGPQLHLPGLGAVAALAGWILVSLVASRDAWRFSAKRR